MFPFKAALNASTLFPFNLDVKQQVQIAAEAGFEGIELWVKDIEAYLQSGGTIKELRRYVADTGVTLVNAIAFFPWADADQATREQGFVQAQAEMEMLTELGCLAVAAPPFGDVEQTSLDAMAASYARLTELARTIGIVPYLEFWGMAKKLSRLSEALYVAMESGQSDVKILLDPFHMYKGGSAISSLTYLRGTNIGIVHANDYPAHLPPATITDADRVFPGEGVAPLREFAQLLDQAGYRGSISLELFIADYGEASAADVAKRGAQAVRTAFAVGE